MNKYAGFLDGQFFQKGSYLRVIQRTLFQPVIIILIISTFLTACSNTLNRAPVQDKQAPPSRKLSRHEVARGETLYSIAWRYNLDYRQLAQANNIDKTYTIHPGQILNLNISKRVNPVKSRIRPKPSAIQRAPSEPQSNPSRSQLPRVVSPARPTVLTPSNTTPATSNNPLIEGSKKRSVAVKKNKSNSKAFNPKIWRWPVVGKILKKFHANGGLQKGIDIQSKLGEPVIAAAPGEVVYAGSGLRGYGKLLIIKHSDRYLSAYAHNRRLLTKEGQRVEAGQKIAEVGSTGTDSVKLHFEIRNDGRPVDPLLYLPKR